MLQMMEDRVLFTEVSQEDIQTETGIWLPDGTDGKLGIGIVVSCGPGPVISANPDGDRLALPLTKGDKFLYYLGMAARVRYGADVYHILRYTDIICVVDDEQVH